MTSDSAGPPPSARPAGRPPPWPRGRLLLPRPHPPLHAHRRPARPRQRRIRHDRRVPSFASSAAVRAASPRRRPVRPSGGAASTRTRLRSSRGLVHGGGPPTHSSPLRAAESAETTPSAATQCCSPPSPQAACPCGRVRPSRLRRRRPPSAAMAPGHPVHPGSRPPQHLPRLPARPRSRPRRRCPPRPHRDPSAAAGPDAPVALRGVSPAATSPVAPSPRGRVRGGQRPPRSSRGASSAVASSAAPRRRPETSDVEGRRGVATPRDTWWRRPHGFPPTN